MKHIYILFVLFYSTSLIAQTSASLDINNISAKVRSDGKLFDGQFEVPKGTGKHSIYTANIWIGGIDAGGQLHMAGQTYAQSGADFFYGPIANNYTTSPYPTTYNRVWKVNKSTIDNHILNYTTGGYVVPASIANWPGNGNIANGEAAKLAPYIDVNSNNTYDPANGDYPEIRGDQAIFYMVNDAKQAHAETGGLKLGIEVHGMAYSYASTDSALNQTLFINFKIYNRSVNNYDSVYFGAWSDMDLGDYADDYVGSDSILNMYYTYNSSNIDGNGTAPSYGSKPPAQGVIFLNNPMSSFVYYNNDFTPQGNPDTAPEYYNYLKGRWKDGSQLTYGGTGYGGTIPSSFMFSGEPETPKGWTEASAGNTPGDRRGIMTAGPFELAAGAELCIDLAYPFARDYTGSNLTSISLLRDRAQSIQAFYNSQNYQCTFLTGIRENAIQKNLLNAYPNPTTGTIIINTNKENPVERLMLYSIEGKKVFDKVESSNNNSISIDIQNLSQGVYFLECITKKGSEKVKVVKY